MPKNTTTIESGCNDNLFNTFNTKYFDATDISKVDAELIKANYDHITQVDNFNKDPNRNCNKLHYVATTIGGLHNNKGNLGTSYNVITYSPENKLLIYTLEKKIGDLGKKISDSNKTNFETRNGFKTDIDDWSIIGKCAEVRVADNFLTIYKHNITDFTTIKFTPARRPRTQEAYLKDTKNSDIKHIIETCYNCQIIFNGK